MAKFKFEIHGSCEDTVEAENADDARMIIIERLADDYYGGVLTEDACVSDGEEVK